ncbi:unnamed protein product [Meloidogyne enterolobii]|uniref:Uncharacterized protein n=1 Tax=Meloidogyne enterolobii TaxID=390850 RepID=A0ACB0ZLI4_MELEN
MGSYCTYYNCLSDDFIINVHKRQQSKNIPYTITETNFCRMMKTEFECTKCCICYKDDCNKDFKECEGHGTKAQRGFKIKPNQSPNKKPILKTKYPITTTTTAITTTSTTTKAKTIKESETTKGNKIFKILVKIKELQPGQISCQ